MIFQAPREVFANDLVRIHFIDRGEYRQSEEPWKNCPFDEAKIQMFFESWLAEQVRDEFPSTSRRLYKQLKRLGGIIRWKIHPATRAFYRCCEIFH
jgi:hypothetical protein